MQHHERYSAKLQELSLKEDKKYGACHFKIDKKAIEFRVSKVTPKKIGQFVAIWKRNAQGLTQPFEETDPIDFMVISSRTADNFGMFIFSKSILIENGMITSNKKLGKRGIRLYPPWEKTIVKQAQKAQSWQTKYFINIGTDGHIDELLMEEIFGGD